MVGVPSIELAMEPFGTMKITIAPIERHGRRGNANQNRSGRDFSDFLALGRRDHDQLVAQLPNAAELSIDIRTDAASARAVEGANVDDSQSAIPSAALI
jgi:hypothetical protein